MQQTTQYEFEITLEADLRLNYANIHDDDRGSGSCPTNASIAALSSQSHRLSNLQGSRYFSLKKRTALYPSAYHFSLPIATRTVIFIPHCDVEALRGQFVGSGFEREFFVEERVEILPLYGRFMPPMVRIRVQVPGKLESYKRNLNLDRRTVSRKGRRSRCCPWGEDWRI